MTSLAVRAVRPADWSTLEGFFGPRGAYGGCWCTYFRRTSAEFSAGCRNGGAGNRELLERLALDDRVPGLLAYDGAEPVGWVSVAPRPEFGRVLRSPTVRPRDPDDPTDAAVWSIVCFWVPPARRGQGVATRLLDAAVAHAGEHRAARVEAYPIDVGTTPVRDDEAYYGTVIMFERAGFERTGRGSARRPVMIKQLS